jgi:deoxyhypusine synthase
MELNKVRYSYVENQLYLHVEDLVTALDACDENNVPKYCPLTIDAIIGLMVDIYSKKQN